MVVTDRPSYWTARARHELIRSPSTSTVHAPQAPLIAPLLRPREAEVLAQRVEQADPSFKLDLELDPVHDKLYTHCQTIWMTPAESLSAHPWL
jgi:hypothetical protein